MRSQAVSRAVFALALCVASPFASATAQRTFVSAIGTDNPNCSIAAPCRSFTAALNASTSGGEIIVLESAGYGPVTITKSVSIIAPPGIYGGISVASGLNGVTIDAPGATVVLRGLSINGQGGDYGILLQQAARVRVENCVVSKMGVVGIHHTAPNAEMIVLDTIVRDNTDGLGLVASNASIILDRVHSEHNTNVGFYIAPTPGSSRAYATIVDSVFVYNGLHGIWADTVGGAATSVHVERSVLNDNGGNGFRSTSGASQAYSASLLRHNALSRNGAAGVLIFATFGGAKATMTDNSLMNNGAPSIVIDGDFIVAYISGNTGFTNSQDLTCNNGAAMVTFDNNSLTNPGNCSLQHNGPGL
jgi:hypothetical protein